MRVTGYRFPVWIALAACLWQSAARAQDFEAEREQFKRAFAAMANGEVSRALELGQGLEDYPLYAYLRYEYLRTRMSQVKPEQIREFFQAYPASLLEANLRTEWLKSLARTRRWREFLDDYQPQSDVVLQCQQLAARIALGRLDDVAFDAVRLWLAPKSQPDECDPAFKVLYTSALMDDDLVWQRIHLAMEAGETSLALFLSRRLSSERDRALVRRWAEVRANPARALRAAELAVDSEVTRHIVLYGVRRLARTDVDQALAHLAGFDGRYAFTSAEHGACLRDLALAAVRADDDDALALLDRVPADWVDKHIDEARLRTAIKRNAWARLVMWTEREPDAGIDRLRWRYWRARALEAEGQNEAARKLYEELAAARDYYGFLAADRLGLPYQMQDIPLQVSAAERTEVLAVPGVVRAREWLALNQRYRARREWHFEIDRLNRRQLEVAALLAHEWGWHDRAILALGRAESLDDLSVRFPVPHQDLVARYSDKRKIPPAVMYSIIRSESAFMVDAQSAAGALGLMQVMPETGREIAAEIGFKLASARQLLQADDNVTLGSAYLKRMLDGFNGSLPMAAAAYNAGPHRVRTWMPSGQCMPADVWIESIPFDETRQYVMRTVFHTAVYEWRLNQEITALNERLAGIPPRRPTGAAATC
jgi:soluble lytic murein transglycosylase